MSELEPEVILSDDLMDISLDYYQSAREFQNFLSNSMA